MAKVSCATAGVALFARCKVVLTEDEKRWLPFRSKYYCATSEVAALFFDVCKIT